MKFLEHSRCSIDVYAPAWVVTWRNEVWVVALLGAAGHSGAQPSNLTQGGGGDCSPPNPPYLYLTRLSSQGRSNSSYVFVVKASLSRPSSQAKARAVFNPCSASLSCVTSDPARPSLSLGSPLCKVRLTRSPSPPNNPTRTPAPTLPGTAHPTCPVSLLPLRPHRSPPCPLPSRLSARCSLGK